MVGKYLLLFTGAVVALFTTKVWCANVPTCTTQQQCLTLQQGTCLGGSRQICLSSNPTQAGCALAGVDTIDFKCSLPSNAPAGVNVVANSAGSTCQLVVGGQDALFAVTDGAAASGFGTFTVSGRSATCLTDGTTQCAGAMFTNTIWGFSTDSCTCSCTQWSNWGSCPTSCMRTRTRTCQNTPPDLSCPGTESEPCAGGSCTNPGCLCGVWTNWGGCSVSCSTETGTFTRTRNCIPNPNLPGSSCPTTVLTMETGSCSGPSQCTTQTPPTTTTTTVSPTTPSPTTPTSATTPACVCTEWSPVGRCEGNRRAGNCRQRQERTCQPTTYCVTQGLERYEPCTPCADPPRPGPRRPGRRGPRRRGPGRRRGRLPRRRGRRPVPLIPRRNNRRRRA